MLRLKYDANLEASSVKSCAVSWVGSNRGRRQASSITPGTLLIILAGRFKGKRHSLLVSPDMFLFCNWPFKINDCHVLKVSDVSLDKYDDQYFGKVGEKKNKKGEGESLMEPWIYISELQTPKGKIQKVYYLYYSSLLFSARLQSQALPCTSSLLSSSSACCLPLVSLLIHSNVSESSRQRERKCLHIGKKTTRWLWTEL
ncbi:hypothetical protein Bca101_072421 [Brassica carinata]